MSLLGCELLKLCGVSGFMLDDKLYPSVIQTQLILNYEINLAFTS